jgi:hypothetical protein
LHIWPRQTTQIPAYHTDSNNFSYQCGVTKHWYSDCCMSLACPVTRLRRGCALNLKMTRYFLLLALVAFTASAAVADGVDPVFKLTGGKLSTPVTDGTFTFTANNTTGTTTKDFSFDYVNQSGTDATSLLLSFLVSPLNLVISVDNTGDPFFTTAALIPPSELGGLYKIYFSGMDETHHGILSQHCVAGPDGIVDADDCTGGGADFVIGINGVPPGAFISGTGQLPEPSTGLSLVLGMAGIAFAFRKMRLL